MLNLENIFVSLAHIDPKDWKFKRGVVLIVPLTSTCAGARPEEELFARVEKRRRRLLKVVDDFEPVSFLSVDKLPFKTRERVEPFIGTRKRRLGFP